ncbi:uncharacterized protein G2W53_013836 [Senna tora]|uniref:Uncharacterized protein n=1 Tax=Senna tora TaxID=362788 RepID=A0A834TZF3_9FABA|nr:uncharacterized protein G2W53_013836 [Senna tora]
MENIDGLQSALHSGLMDSLQSPNQVKVDGRESNRPKWQLLTLDRGFNLHQWMQMTEAMNK